MAMTSGIVPLTELNNRVQWLAQPYIEASRVVKAPNQDTNLKCLAWRKG